MGSLMELDVLIYVHILFARESRFYLFEHYVLATSTVFS